ncbi:hypothetical protein [Propionivibrio limicola]|uniref:hypothetical protein n=1 Tax=Propionivibrio limicola TaxID=167645 RepID=UPI001292381F|nr:hypothetical protein [Propionivibrio limicola]
MKRLATPPRPAPIRKERTILFSEFPPGQTQEAADFLSGLERLEVRAHPEDRAIGVTYDLHDYSLEALEIALMDNGFRLECSLLNKIVRALIHYVEETQLHNLDAPNHPLKKSQHEAYTQAWERHPHGDHDDTPPEWREYK